MQHYFQTLVFFLQINAFYGKLILASFLPQAPVNILINLWLINGQVEHVPIVLFFSGHEHLLIFSLHLMLAQCTSVIHQGKGLFRFASSPKEAFNLKARIKLDRDIAAIHTKRRYGFTYGPFGLISLTAFTKVNPQFLGSRGV